VRGGRANALTPALSRRREREIRARQANSLRHWLKTAHAATASAAQLEELLDQVADCTTRGHQIRIKVGAGFVARQGERLAYLP
jgi:tRNA(Ile)-lysidine synthase